MLLRKVEHIGINVSDMERSLAFYTQVLGLPLRGRVKLGEKTELAFVSLGDAEIELVWKQGAELEHAREGIVNHLAFTVDDVGAVLAHLRGHGVKLLNEEPVVLGALGARVAFFHGPDGEKLELFAKD
jgi:lactoylglutathione lyase